MYKDMLSHLAPLAIIQIVSFVRNNSRQKTSCYFKY